MASQAVQQQLDALAKPSQVPAALPVADALSDAESSSMEEPAASGKGRRAIARRSSLTVEATAQPTVTAPANGASDTCSLWAGEADFVHLSTFVLLCLATPVTDKKSLGAAALTRDVWSH